MNTLRTPEQACAWFRANGISISDWCREHGFSRYTVVDLLRGKRRGYRGEAHRVAVALQLKPRPRLRWTGSQWASVGGAV